MKHLADAHALLHDGIQAVVDLVEEMHVGSARKPVEMLAPLPGVGEGARLVGTAHDGVAGLVYGSIRLVRRMVEAAGTAALRVAEESRVVEHAEARIEAPVARKVSAWGGTAQSALNAWIGDFLERRENGLAIDMGFIDRGERVALTPEGLARACEVATGKVCIFVHGLGCSEDSWRLGSLAQYGDAEVDYGRLLARDLGYTPLYLRYNTGRHISDNARELAMLLEQLVASYPCEIEELALIGHSMGGLVARGAAHYADRDGAQWVRRLTHVLCIGSPHLGAPLEQATHALSALLSYFDVPGTKVPAKLLNTRSAGIKDLRHGYVLDEDWRDKDPDAWTHDAAGSEVPLVASVAYGFVAASVLRDPKHPLGAFLGDILVRVPSASGRAEDESCHVPFHVGEVVHGVHHLALLNHPDVYAQVLRFLAQAPAVICSAEAPQAG